MLKTIDELQFKIDQLTTDLRSSRDSCERLRKTIANNSIFVKNPKESMKHSNIVKKAISTQTKVQQTLNQMEKSKNSIQVGKIMSLLHAILSSLQDVSSLNSDFDSILNCFESILEFGMNSQENFFESYPSQDSFKEKESLVELFLSFLLKASIHATYSQVSLLTNLFYL